MMLSHNAFNALGAFVEHESSTGTSTGDVKSPAAVHHSAPLALDIDDQLPSRTRPTDGPATPTTPTTPAELEASLTATATPTPNQPHVDALVYSLTNPVKNKWRVGSSSLTFLLMGMNDAATGALIPYIEKEYKIGYAVVSLIFITYALGFVSAAPLVGHLDAKLGRSRLFMLSQILACAGYLTISFAPPFAVVVLAFLLLGFGFATFLAVTNSWIVNLRNGTVLLGCCHGVYGAGGVISPLIATAMVSHGVRWSRFYLILLGIAALSLPCMGWAYHDFEQDFPAQLELLTVLERSQMQTQTQTQTQGQTEPKKRLLAKSLKDKTTLLGATFIFFYQGGEVAVSGWVISYLINYRGGAPSKVGNVTAGFWGGITLGRFILTPLAHRMGEKRAVFILTAGAAVFQALVWAIPNILSNAVAESLVGLFLGPVYPCATAVLSKLWPGDIQITGLSLVTSMGSSGGALVPFVTGLMAQKLSTVVLHPIVLFAFGVMMLVWVLLPRIEKRSAE